jgi:hypothetical protein
MGLQGIEEQKIEHLHKKIFTVKRKASYSMPSEQDEEQKVE